MTYNIRTMYNMLDYIISHLNMYIAMCLTVKMHFSYDEEYKERK